MKRVGRFAFVPIMAAAVWAADDQFGFMPDGGRTILTDLVHGMKADEVRALLKRKEQTDFWIDWAQGLDPDLNDVAVQTFASYATLNLPLDDSAIADMTVETLPEVLPPDGKDLSIAQCQFCHSLFSGYLMHDRDLTGWKGTFKAPFHTEIPMSEVERDTFAGYSALNMPLKFEDVPPELRF